ncbi:MAG: hypothetical protein IKQ10_00265 [Oscillospiraceae bacterium]|nr:hypothetical protein [Oscillospiraceae bacterium]
MKVRATKGFCGPLCMAIGEVREITNEAYLKDLLRAGYVVPVEPTAEPAAPAAEAEAPKAEAPKRGSRKKAVSAK